MRSRALPHSGGRTVRPHPLSEPPGAEPGSRHNLKILLRFTRTPGGTASSRLCKAVGGSRTRPCCAHPGCCRFHASPSQTTQVDVGDFITPPPPYRRRVQQHPTGSHDAALRGYWRRPESNRAAQEEAVKTRAETITAERAGELRNTRAGAIPTADKPASRNRTGNDALRRVRPLLTGLDGLDALRRRSHRRSLRGKDPQQSPAPCTLRGSVRYRSLRPLKREPPPPLMPDRADTRITARRKQRPAAGNGHPGGH